MMVIRWVFFLVISNILVHHHCKQIHFKAYPPFYVNGDIFGYQAALDVGVAMLQENEDILPGYNITIHYSDAERTSGIAAKDFLSTIQKREYPMQFVFGPYHERADDIVKYITEQWSVPMSVERSQEDESFFLANIKLLLHYNWRRIAIIQAFNNVGENLNEMKSRFEEHGIEVAVIGGTYFDNAYVGFEPLREVEALFNEIEEKDVRIIFMLNIDFNSLANTFCYISSRNMTGEKYQYITTDATGMNLVWNGWSISRPLRCHRNALSGARNMIRVVPKSMRDENAVTTYNQRTVGEMHDLVKQRHVQIKKQAAYRSRRPLRTLRMMHLVDQVYQVGLTYHNLLAESNNASAVEMFFTTSYKDRKKYLQFQKAFQLVQFNGVAGMYTPQRNQMGNQYDISYEFWNPEIFRFVNGGTYNVMNNSINMVNIDQLNKKEDKNKSNKIGDLPKNDRKLQIVTFEVYKKSVLYAVWSICVLGIVVAVILFFLNNRYKNIKALKMTSPSINNIIIFGAILCYISILLYGIDAGHILAKNITSMCSVSTFILTIGYTLIFGSLFGKTWRVYKIFSSSRHNKKMKLKDHHIIGFVLILLGIDIVVLVAWFLISPFQLQNREISVKELPDQDVVVRHMLNQCNCKYRTEFIIAIIIEKGILMVLGTFLAWETRNVTIPILNDSRYIGVSIYTVAITAVVGTISTMALHDTALYNEAYLVLSISVCIATATTTCLTIIPKVVVMFGKNTLERRRTVSTSSMNMKNATENVLRSQRFREEKLKDLEQTSPKQFPGGAAPTFPTQIKDPFAIHSVQQQQQPTPYNANGSPLPGPSRRVKKTLSFNADDDDAFKA